MKPIIVACLLAQYLTISACRENDSPIENIIFKAPIDSMKITLDSCQMIVLNASSPRNNLVAQFVVTLENQHDELPITDIKFVSITLSSDNKQWTPFQPATIWNETPDLSPNHKQSATVYRFASLSPIPFSCGDSLTAYITIAANNQEIKTLMFSGLPLECGTVSSYLDSLEINLQKSIVYADYMPIISPDPVISVFNLQIHNPTQTIISGLQFCQADFYNGSEPVGSILFREPAVGNLFAGETKTDTLYKGVSGESLFHVPECGTYLNADLILRDYQNHFRVIRIDSMPLGCTGSTNETNHSLK